MTRNRLFSFLLAVVLSVSFALPVLAAEGNGDVDAKILTLAQKYDITIRYDTNSNGGACIGTGALATLDAMLGIVTPEVVRSVSAYMGVRTGNKLSYHFTYDFNSDLQLAPDQEVLGAFNPNTGEIKLYLPSSSRGSYSSGDNPLTMIHEFGHALHMMLESQYGAASLEADWTALNGAFGYKGSLGDGQYSDTTFFSEYAATEYGEDFAEAFAHSVIRNRAGLGFSYLLNKDGARTNLGKKIDLLTSALTRCIPGSAGLVANIQNNAAYTPIYASYQNLQLYGIKLEYINCAWPSAVLQGIMGGIGEEITSSQWVYEIGGWYTQGGSGNYYLIFPGGHAQLLKEPLPIAA